MNSNITSTVINMGADELKSLTTETKETVASEHFVKSDKLFSVADLWNIQRGRKTQHLSSRATLSRRNTIV